MKMNNKSIRYRIPCADDGPQIFKLVRSCPPLDLNSRYHYILLADHFAATSVVAEQTGKIVGYVSAYIHPKKPDTLFVWQVAVGDTVRRRGVGRALLEDILQRKGLEEVTYLETTVTPSNKPSRAMFLSLAQVYETPCDETPYFKKELFGEQGHEEERLLRIGPFQKCAGTQQNVMKEEA